MTIKSILQFLLPAALTLLLAACGGESQPLPDIDATVEARVAEERAKAAEATVEAIVEATVQAVLTEDNVLFPDAGLDAAIREALGKAVQDKITTKELAKLVKLDCSACGILDLTGLEYVTNLTRLYLRGNPLDLNDIQALRNRGVHVFIDD